ncbi:MAG: peptidoglycan D,D-transpeptidase FtsI family protein [Ectobacillus sp.]
MKWRKRAIAVLVCFVGIILLLMGRLMQLQLIATESFSDRHINLLEKSVAQRTHTVVLDDGRGRFTDRNGEALTDDYHPSLILFPFLTNMQWPRQKVAHILDTDVSEFTEQIRRADAPFVFQKEGKAMRLTEKQMKAINELGIPGVVAANARVKGEQALAEHLIGLTGENAMELEKRYGDKLKQGKITKTTPIGISGLQRTFDEFLLTDGEAKLLYHVDRQGEPIFGKNVKYTKPANPFYPVIIQTTIDKTLQARAEEIVKQSGLEKGGIVLLDVKTNEILAMVSNPSLNTSSIEAYRQGAVNYMLSPQFPGSVFKTVIAAAAIDHGLNAPGRTFDCNSNPYGEGTAERPMGMLTFEESFARSCNRTFADLGQELVQKDKNIIEKYANILGVTGTVGWKGHVFHFPEFRQLEEEQKGTIWTDERDKSVKKAIAQTAIGQKDVRLSPLAVANMMATIARGGEKLEVKAVREIEYKNGAKLYRFPNHKLAGEQLSPKTVHKVQELLRGVVSSPNGTGAAYEGLPLSIAGKSGTAQTGKEHKVNRWFAGYFPHDNPRYALVSVELETDKAENASKTVFAETVKAVARWEQETNRDVEPR